MVELSLQLQHRRVNKKYDVLEDEVRSKGGLKIEDIMLIKEKSVRNDFVK